MGEAQVPEMTPLKVPLVLVDDDVSVRRSMSRLVQSFGLAVETFASAEEFLEAPRTRAIPCLILDIHLGGMSGLDLYKRLVASGDPPPVIFITAHDTPQVRSQASAFGAVAYFRKPFDGASLLNAIGDAVGCSFD